MRGIVSVVLAAALVSACSGSGDDKPEAAATTSASPTASPTPTVPPQEPTEYGTNAIISNWDEYYDDPVVQAYREFRAAGAAAINERKVVPELEESMTNQYGDQLIANLREAWSRDWRIAPEVRSTIESATTDGAKSTVISCEVRASASFKNADGAFVNEEVSRGSVRVKSNWIEQGSDKRWLLEDLELQGDC